MRPERVASDLLDALERCRALTAWSDDRLFLRVEDVSAWSVAQHLQHVLKSLRLMLAAIRTLREGHDERIGAQGAPAFLGRIMMWTGWIPRGVGKTPDVARPDAVVTRANLARDLGPVCERAREVAAFAGALPTVPGTLPHPALGPFRAAHWLRFARLHTLHHLAIVDDIDRHLAAAQPAARPASSPGACG